MFEKLMEVVAGFVAKDDLPPIGLEILSDKKLCSAALLVQMMVADGKIVQEEEDKLLSVLQQHYGLSGDEASQLAAKAKLVQAESVDFFRFTNALKGSMSIEEREGLVEDLWEIVYADGELHEFEDNLVWRMAELLNISSERRLALKRLVRKRAGGS